MDFPTLTDTPTTWAGLAPTHSARPAEYQAAIDAADAAWQEYHAYTDEVFVEGEDATGTAPEQWSKLNALLVAACAAENAKEAAYREWQAQLAAEYVREPSQYDEHGGAFLP